eukprot:4723408-Amphidinium_carterae.1
MSTIQNTCCCSSGGQICVVIVWFKAICVFIDDAIQSWPWPREFNDNFFISPDCRSQGILKVFPGSVLWLYYCTGQLLPLSSCLPKAHSAGNELHWAD